ncbi:MAG: GNAT family N-acetyltransferase [Burkholderiales bacterium]
MKNLPAIEHVPERSRFQTIVEGKTCVCDYQLSDGVMQLTHTLVPPPLEGRGIAAALVEAALAHARSEGLKVNPICSYVQLYMRRHPETQDLLE